MNRPLPTVDPIEELRLRRWARENYAPADQRSDLHPVIIHEMQRKDDEIGEPAQLQAAKPLPLFSSNIVPLMPDEIPGFHGPHELTPPHSLTTRVESEELHYT